MSELHPRFFELLEKQEVLISRKNERAEPSNGVFERWKYPVLTRDHVPIHWRYDLDARTNPRFLERLGVNAVFNAGAIERERRGRVQILGLPGAPAGYLPGGDERI